MSDVLRTVKTLDYLKAQRQMILEAMPTVKDASKRKQVNAAIAELNKDVVKSGAPSSLMLTLIT